MPSSRQAISSTSVHSPASNFPSPNSTISISPLGWNWIPNRDEGEYFISPQKLPKLSSAETWLVHAVLQQFYSQHEWQRSHEDLFQTLRAHCTQNQLQLDAEQEKYLFQMLQLHAWEYGPLSLLLSDPSLEEIAIAGIGENFPVRVYVAQQGWKTTPIYFSDTPQLITTINRMALSTGKRLSQATPTLNARLEDGSRLHASMFPVCLHGVEVTIRKFVFRAQDAQQLVRSQIISHEAMAFLQLAMQTDCNILVVGNTGSGKTTTLNALLGTISPRERFILVEETPELQLLQPHIVRLTPSPGAKIELAELIRETLRMRPDRVVVGEMRYPEEAKAFMECILAGQGKGTYGTFHGHSAEEAGQ